MSSFRCLIESNDLARVFTNALAFFPAKSVIDTALIRVWPDHIETTGTDTYTLGRDTAPIREFSAEVPEFPIVVELNREGWQDIEKNARKDKGGVATLEFLAGDALIYNPSQNSKGEKGVAQDFTGKSIVKWVDGESMRSKDVWDMCDELLELVDSRETQEPTNLCFDPQLLGRFNKVKTPDDYEANKVVDFYYQGEGHAVLAKVGPSFTGLIMPIDREVYAEKQPDGQEGLW